MRICLALILLVGCRTHKTPDPIDPPQAILDLYASASDRLLGMLDQGFVVSRGQDQSVQHQGDSLIWTGIALAALPCDKGDQIELALRDMMQTLHGGLWRHPSLPDKISLDGAIGVYRGIAKRIERCGSLWTDILEQHLALGKLNPDADITWPLEFRYVPELALAVANGSPIPDSSRLATLTRQVSEWAGLVSAAHSACYRINLGYQTLKTIEELGQNVDKSQFCLASRGTHLATVDRYCGLGDGQEFIANFGYDEWEYHPQRCDWEGGPDGDGFHTPAVDLLEMVREVYSVPE